MPPNDFATRLEALIRGATKGPLMVYNSCSFRRIGLKNDHKEVLWPCVSRSDGHPDLSGINTDDDLALLIYLYNHAPALLRLVRAAKKLNGWSLSDPDADKEFNADVVEFGAALAALNAEDKT